jgi:methylthioribose-1-phosphate isomerase
MDLGGRDILPTIRWDGGKVRIIDQVLLPHDFRIVECGDYRDLIEAIKGMRIRGAPAIGIAGAFALALGARSIKEKDVGSFLMRLEAIASEISSARPTAVNLEWAVNRLMEKARRAEDVDSIPDILLSEAEEILREDIETSISIGVLGSELVNDGDVVLTHCNTGGLATGGWGTALAIIYEAKRQGKRVKVFVDETRPLLQGARLTAWELKRAGIDVSIVCDSSAPYLMRKGMVSLVLVGADRIARNGDFANKIGTYGLALAANANGIPFYVAAPTSTIDPNLMDGEGINVEVRDESEVLSLCGRRIGPEGVGAYNPAFDVTPGELVDALITEKMVVRRPVGEGIGILTRGSDLM